MAVYRNRSIIPGLLPDLQYILEQRVKKPWRRLVRGANASPLMSQLPLTLPLLRRRKRAGFHHSATATDHNRRRIFFPPSPASCHPDIKPSNRSWIKLEPEQTSQLTRTDGLDTTSTALELDFSQHNATLTKPTTSDRSESCGLDAAMKGLSKETRIKIFIGVDIVFFLIEIVIGETCATFIVSKRTTANSCYARLLCPLPRARGRCLSYAQ